MNLLDCRVNIAKLKTELSCDNLIEVIVYESVLKEAESFHSYVVNDLADFSREAGVIVTNRSADDICDVVRKGYSRNLYGDN